MKKVTLSLSFTAFDIWETQDPKLLIDLLLKKPKPKSAALENGIAKHKEWEQFIKANKSIPDELGGGALNNPVTELFLEEVIEVSEYLRLILRGKLDCKDGLKAWDWKTGKKPAEDYLQYSSQHQFYKVLSPTLTEFEYRCLNQDKKKLTIATAPLGDDVLAVGLAKSIEYSTGIARYLQREKVLREVLRLQSYSTGLTLERKGVA